MKLPSILSIVAVAMIAWPATGAAQGMPPAAVIVSEIVEEQIAPQVFLVGNVRARHTSRVATETEGKVVAILKDAGRPLLRGDAIIRLENEQLRAALEEALADVKLQKFNFQQSSDLFDQEAVAEQVVRDSEYELDRARAKLADLRSLRQAMEVRAPYNGFVVQTLVGLGEWVNRGDEVVHVVSTDTVRVQVDAPERYVDKLKPGDMAAIYVDALGADPYEGQIVAVLNQGFDASHTFPVIIETRNPDHRIRSGMSARVKFTLHQPAAALLVHKDALVTGPAGQVVYIAVDQKASSRPVKTGLAYKGFVSVEGDLKAGDLAIVRGNERLMEGRDIQIIRKQER